jgi:hypothetical protein
MNDGGHAGPSAEHRFVETVWRAVQGLQPRQRAALLLYAHDGGGRSALPLLSRAGVASFAEIARLVDIPDAALRRLWASLPLDDLQIGAQFGITWVQVENLRNTARAILARRLGDLRFVPALLDVSTRGNDIVDLAAIWRAELVAVCGDRHPPAELLAALLAGRLGDADREAVGGHVEVCVECAASLTSIRGNQPPAAGSRVRRLFFRRRT